MAFVIAITGKGGVGKTTIAALLIKALVDKSGDVILGVDADPNVNLGQKLGVEVDRTIGGLREDLIDRAEELPAGMSKHEHVRYQIQMALIEGEEFDLLSMGRSEGPGCYCYINNILRTFMDDLMDDYTYVVIDNEAGMEHLSRRTTKKMDVLAMVADPTKLGVETARRISTLADEMELEVDRKALLLNRAPKDIHPAVQGEIDKGNFDEVVKIPHDKQVEELTVVGEPLTQVDSISKSFRRIKKWVKGF
ncbi:MAG: AAA family ATPase [Methanomassiliicoccales archaeon]